jgi:hypothetical protein
MPHHRDRVTTSCREDALMSPALNQERSSTNCKSHYHGTTSGKTDCRASVSSKGRARGGSGGTRSRSCNSCDSLEQTRSRGVCHGVAFKRNAGEWQDCDRRCTRKGESFGSRSGGLQRGAVIFARGKDTWTVSMRPTSLGRKNLRINHMSDAIEQNSVGEGYFCVVDPSGTVW